MVLAVRQLVDKLVVPAAHDLDIAHAHPARLVAALAELGILGALVDPGHGGLGLDLRTTVMIVEELARGSATLAAILVAHLTATHAIARFGTAEQRERLLPAMARGEILGTVAFTDGIRATRTSDGWILDGETPPVDHAAHAAAVLVPAVSADDVALFVVGPGMPGFSADRPEATLGLRGLESGRLRFEGCRVAAQNRLDGAAGRALEQRAAVLEVARLGALAPRYPRVALATAVALANVVRDTPVSLAAWRRTAQ